ncbi:MAG: hypothetical protein PHX08_08885 [Lachnospiraceae bacterium]|nr:hypothetical protein [Lachnospiraceae bacterium]
MDEKEKFEKFMSGEDLPEKKEVDKKGDEETSDVKDDETTDALDDAIKIEEDEGESAEANNLEKIKEEYEAKIKSLESEIERLKDRAWKLFTKVQGEPEKKAEKKEEPKKKNIDEMYSIEE